MQPSLALAACFALLALAACDVSEPRSYPLSDDACTADDPVLDLDAGDCTLPAVGPGV